MKVALRKFHGLPGILLSVSYNELVARMSDLIAPTAASDSAGTFRPKVLGQRLQLALYLRAAF
ncbi:hypothetical protein [Caballeronia sp. 15711]|uniref:hypothetical protein n=1 Tax=Caballeronia sp. 15711 TaxID=3391029 RepID=UPI0039E3466C